MSKFSKNIGLLLGGTMGLATSWAISAPKSPVKKKLPSATIKNVEFVPNLKVTRKNKVYHIHHWMYFSVFYGSLMLVRRPFRGKKFLNAFLLGLIFQGLSYKDRLSVKKPHDKKLLLKKPLKALNN